MRSLLVAGLVFLLLAVPAHATGHALPGAASMHFDLGQGTLAGPDFPMALAGDGSAPAPAPLPSHPLDCVVDGKPGGGFGWRFEGQAFELTELIAVPDGQGHVRGELTSRVPLPSGLLLARLDAPGLDGGLMVTRGAVGSTYVPALLPGQPQQVSIAWLAARDGLFLLEFGGRAVRLTLAFCPDAAAGEVAVANAAGMAGKVEPLVTFAAGILRLDAAPVPMPPAELAPLGPAPIEARTVPGLQAFGLALALACALALRRRA
jgi:hypothetical protein